MNSCTSCRALDAAAARPLSPLCAFRADGLDLGVRQGEVAGGPGAAVLRGQRGLLDRADLLARGAAGVEAAGGRRVGRARHVAVQDLATAACDPRLRDRHRGEQYAGVWV